MKLADAQRLKLRAWCKGRTRAEVKALFKLVRAHDDRTLLAALPSKKKRAAKRKGDPLGRDLDAILKPLLAPSAEKADLLIEHMAKAHRRKLNFEPKGLADAARRLRLHFSDAQIRTGAQSLMTDLAKHYAGRETVV